MFVGVEEPICNPEFYVGTIRVSPLNAGDGSAGGNTKGLEATPKLGLKSP